jgi:subtilisin family serine protease
MSRHLRSCILVFTLICAVCAQAGGEPAAYRPGEILVMFDPGASPSRDGALVTSDTRFAAWLSRHGLDRAVPVSPTRDRSAASIFKVISDRPDFDPLAAAHELTGEGSVRAVSPNYVLHLCSLPDDPMVSTQWHIQHAGDADIDLPEAWDVAMGDPGVVIAVLDTGVDWSHPDLQAAMWTNPGETPDNGVDDDGNGWIDDRYGWDVGNDDNDPRPEVYLETGIDVGFHGTHCAGIAAAATDNATGVAGAGWGCRLMGLKMNDSDGNITTEGLTEGIQYAVANGASVISMSFGGSLADFGFMQALVDDAVTAGVVCVAAAGNNNDAALMYPAALDGVISVGATDDLNQRASFSTYGAWVDVAAPGQQIWSTVQSNYDWDFLTQLLFMLSYGWDGVNPYMYSDGTSMACPLVAGVCGLIKSVRPDFTPDQVLQRLVETGDVIAFDQPLGVKVNAFAALDGLDVTAAGVPPRTLRIEAVSPNPFNPRTSISFDLQREQHVRMAVHDVRGARVRLLYDGPLPAGAHAHVWDGRADDGRVLSSGPYVIDLRAGGRRDARTVVLLK